MRGFTGWGLVLTAALAFAAAAPASGVPAGAGPQAPTRSVAVPTDVARPAALPMSTAAARTLPRFRCSAWTFIPPATTRCTVGTLDRLRVIPAAGGYFAWSTARGTWVLTGYSWNAVLKRLQLDARRVVVAAPSPGVATKVYRWTCARWTFRAADGVTTCTSGVPQRVLARFDSVGSPASVFDLTQGRFVATYYRWNRHGGFLSLDAALIPAPDAPAAPAPPVDPPAPPPPVPVATVDLGSTMQPRPDPAIPDFVVRCASGSTTATIAATEGATVTFDGATYSSSAVVSVPLSAGQAVRWTLQLPSSAPVVQEARCLPADFPAFVSSRTGTPSSQWYLFTPTLGAGVGATKYVVVADTDGIPVWWWGSTAYAPIDARVLPTGGLGWNEMGYTFSLISQLHRSSWSGVQAAPVGAGLGLDHHEILPTSDGNYLGIRYVFRDCPTTPSECVDMTFAGGSTAGVLIDGEIVKFSPAGQVLWTWRARDHIGLSEWADLASPTNAALSRLDFGGHDNWDIDHINSVEEDGDGVIVSFRHLDAVYRIRTSDGSIDWKLGGTPTSRSLAVIGLDRYPFTASQHDARRLPDEHISIFDNGTEAGRAPRSIEVAVDPVARTAALVRQLSDAQVPTSICCGSTRPVTGGGWFTAWGGTGWMTETDGSGHPVLSMNYSSTFSYRAVPILPGVVSAATLEAGMDTMYPRSS